MAPLSFFYLFVFLLFFFPFSAGMWGAACGILLADFLQNSYILARQCDLAAAVSGQDYRQAPWKVNQTGAAPPG